MRATEQLSKVNPWLLRCKKLKILKIKIGHHRLYSVLEFIALKPVQTRNRRAEKYLTKYFRGRQLCESKEKIPQG